MKYVGDAHNPKPRRRRVKRCRPRRPAILLPAGVHNLRITTAFGGRSPNGHTMITLKLQAGCFTPFYENLVFTERSAWKVREFLRALGREPIDGMEVNTSDLLGLTPQAEVTVEEYNGRAKNKVRKWLPSNGAIVAQRASSLLPVRPLALKDRKADRVPQVGNEPQASEEVTDDEIGI